MDQVGEGVAVVLGMEPEKALGVGLGFCWRLTYGGDRDGVTDGAGDRAGIGLVMGLAGVQTGSGTEDGACHEDEGWY